MISSIKFHENCLSGSLVISYARKDGQSAFTRRSSRKQKRPKIAKPKQSYNNKYLCPFMFIRTIWNWNRDVTVLRHLYCLLLVIAVKSSVQTLWRYSWQSFPQWGLPVIQTVMVLYIDSCIEGRQSCKRQPYRFQPSDPQHVSGHANVTWLFRICSFLVLSH
jgi:hypothetical protein